MGGDLDRDTQGQLCRGAGRRWLYTRQGARPQRPASALAFQPLDLGLSISGCMFPGPKWTDCSGIAIPPPLPCPKTPPCDHSSPRHPTLSSAVKTFVSMLTPQPPCPHKWKPWGRAPRPFWPVWPPAPGRSLMWGASPGDGCRRWWLLHRQRQVAVAG